MHYNFDITNYKFDNGQNRIIKKYEHREILYTIQYDNGNANVHDHMQPKDKIKEQN